MMDLLSKGEVHTPRANKIYREEASKFKLIKSDSMYNYNVTLNFLRREGLDKKHMKTIDNFSAWDYGRCGIIGRYASAVGYVSDDVAMDYMVTAGQNAAKDYKNWKDYIAAYFLGRALAYGIDDIEDYGGKIKGWLNLPYVAFSQAKLHF